MFCKLCGTPLGARELTCPNCGHMARPGGREGDRPKEKEKDAGRAKGGVRLQEGPELEMEEGAAPGAEGGVEEEGGEAMTPSKGLEAPTPLFALDPAGLRKLLAKQPELLESGLSVLSDDKGKPVGAGYASGVGGIDLLARDESGSFVVVQVADRGQGEELVAETLQRIGWVRKHLGKGKQKVRGIVLVEHSPENLSYTASAVAGTITFKTYRVEVTFEDVEM